MPEIRERPKLRLKIVEQKNAQPDIRVAKFAAKQFEKKNKEAESAEHDAVAQTEQAAENAASDTAKLGSRTKLSVVSERNDERPSYGHTAAKTKGHRSWGSHPNTLPREGKPVKDVIRPEGRRSILTRDRQLDVYRGASLRQPVGEPDRRRTVKRLLRKNAVHKRSVIQWLQTPVSHPKKTLGLLSGAAGWSGSAVILIAVCGLALIGALAASPLGILFSNEVASEGVPLNAAIAQINNEYSLYLDELQTGEYSNVEVVGQPPDWREVVAVFAAKTAGSEDGTDVLTFDDARIALLREVFWDMTVITTEETETEVEPEEESEEPTVEVALTITITAKTAAEMRVEYGFSAAQNSALDALLEELDTLGVLMGDLEISQEDALALLNNLPEELPEERKAVIKAALSLVGKVNYFWGGKSLTLGWDSRWGTTMQVTSDGSPTTGTYRPFGLDCSGFVDWAFYNATAGDYYPGHGGGTIAQHDDCVPIPWSSAQPGDLVFYPADEHVGIVGGEDADGNLLVIHCAAGYNNVVITGIEGFTSAARPSYYNG